MSEQGEEPQYNPEDAILRDIENVDDLPEDHDPSKNAPTVELSEEKLKELKQKIIDKNRQDDGRHN